MAEAFVKVVLDNLNSLIQKEFGLLWGFKKEMEKLSSTLSTISLVLEDAEEKQFKDRAIKNWLQKLRDASYELEDILDECAVEASLMKYGRQRSLSCHKVLASKSSSCFNLKKAFSHHEVAKKMVKIRDRLDEIVNERVKFHLQEVVVDRPVRLRELRQTSSIITQPQVYGREEDKKKIVEFLVEKTCGNRDVSIYPIVGIGGMGKTTLAQHVFNDERLINHFELKIWICVSEEFDVRRLIKAIIESASRSTCDSLDLDPLQKNLQDMLRNKRFLIVLDDVWNENQEEWDRVKHVLNCGSNGSSIIVTTRLKKVALIMGTTPMHHLSGLSEDHCWLLFKQRAFGDEEQPNLLNIGKEIVRKCGGVPLAAKTLGSLMRFKRKENDWLSVKDNELWNLPQDENSILPALRLSYLHLPIELRRCFAYCALFPKDFVMHRRKLICLWMANGLISSEGMEAEEIGNEICDELYWRSFFTNYRNDKSGNPTDFFTMHDLMHDLAKSIMEDECIDVGSSVKSSSRRVRHVFCEHTSLAFGKLPDVNSTLRTFTANWNHGVSWESHPKFPYHLNDFPSLRAFDIGGCSFVFSISSFIRYHKHLRYLNLSSADIRILPKAICSLPNLQTLDLSYCRELQKLPKHITRLKSLRHLYIKRCISLSHTPPYIGRLVCLKTLSIFIVDEKRGHRLEELQGLNLGGYLRIQNLQKVRTSLDAKRTNLNNKKDLEDLCLCWGENDPQSPEKVEQVLEALEPPPNLRYLLIKSYEGFCLPRWFDTRILGNIVDIVLARCKNVSLLPPVLGKLPSLKSLAISGMNSLQYLNHEDYNGIPMRGFTSLTSLHMKALPNLEKLSRAEGREMFPYLSILDIEKCPKLTLSCLPSIQSLTLKECSEVTLQSIRKLSTLTDLYLFDNDEMTYFPDGMLQNLNSLKSLTVGRFDKLQELCFDMLIGLSSLKTLRIFSCYELKCFRVGILQGTISLENIDFEDCLKFKSYYTSSITFSALQSLTLFGELSELEDDPDCFKNLPSLEILYLTGYSSLRRLGSFWDAAGKEYPSYKLVALPGTIQYLSSLQQLHISHFPNLGSLPDSFRNLTSLQNLSIEDCPKLECLPETIQYLSSLQRLSISGFPNLGLLPDWLGNLTSLCDLSIINCPKLECLPETIQYLSSLQRLSISDFPNLGLLPDWLGNLTSLCYLSIINCPKLECLPTNIQNLTKLKVLWIESCPRLTKKCREESGEEWYKIAHIPSVSVRASSPFPQFEE